MSFAKGDLVTRQSYNHDLLFRVASVKRENVELYGEDIRLKADAPVTDLEMVQQRELEKRRKREQEKEEFS
ncbi:sporulation peptidase YabG, partial [Virgibacillus salexigens]